MMKKTFRLLLVSMSAALLLSTATLTGCETTNGTGGSTLPVMTFDHLQPIPLRVGMLKTHEEEGRQLITAESFVVSPYVVLEQYLHSRFKPSGYDGALQAYIQDASIKHMHQESPQQFNKYLKVGGVDVYDMTIVFKLEHQDGQGRPVYSTVLTGRRTIKVSEHASISNRERAQYDAMEALFKEIDREVLRIVLGDMGLGMGGAGVPQ